MVPDLHTLGSETSLFNEIPTIRELASNITRANTDEHFDQSSRQGGRKRRKRAGEFQSVSESSRGGGWAPCWVRHQTHSFTWLLVLLVLPHLPLP